MSIIHDALKRVQQGLASKADETGTDPSVKTQQDSAYIYPTTPAPAENLTQTAQKGEKGTAPDSSQKNKALSSVKTILALTCAMTITAGSVWYIYLQFRNNIPRIQRMAKKSFYQMIHKEEIPDFKTKKPEDLKPLAMLTINPPASSSTINPPAPMTLNIHGIMSNGTGNLALINDQVYQEGDTVDGAKILKISLDSITVDINGKEETIHVKN